MSAMITVQFIRAVHFVKGKDHAAVTATMDTGPLGDGGGSYGGHFTIILRTTDEAQLLIDALTTARDALTGDTP